MENKTFQVTPPKKGDALRQQLADLLVATRDGDTRAEDNLYALLYPYMRAECRKLFPGKPEDAEDALQNTMLQISRKHKTVKDPEALLGWCYKVCHSVCYNYMRAEAKYEDVDHMDFDLPDLTEADMPGYALEREEVEALGRGIVQSLPDKQAAVYDMVLDGIPEKDIAEELNMPEGSVKSSRRYAKEKLRREARRMEREDNVAFRGLGEHSMVPILAILLAVLIAMTVALGMTYYTHSTPANPQSSVTEREAPEQDAGKTTTNAPEDTRTEDTLNPGGEPGGDIANTVDTGGNNNPNATPAGGGGGTGGGANAAANTQPTVAGQQYIRPDGRLTAVSETSDWSDIVEAPMETISESLNALGPALTDAYRKPYIATAKTLFDNDVLKAESILVNMCDNPVLVTSFDDYVVRLRNGETVAKGSFVFSTPIRVEPNGSVGISLFFPEGYYDKSLAGSLQDDYVQGINDVAAFIDNSTRIHYTVVQ